MRINFKNLTVQVIIAIILGIIVGALFPSFGAELKVLADVFINLIKMLIAPIIFLTVVVGIGSMGDMKKVGKIGGKALLYFEVVSTISLAIGLIVVNIIKPVDTPTLKGASCFLRKQWDSCYQRRSLFQVSLTCKIRVCHCPS